MDRAETRLETSRRVYSGLDPLDHKRRESGRGPETGNLRRLPPPPRCGVDGSGKTSAECKRNLLDHPDVAQR